MDANRVGRWSALFGGRRSFQEEIKSAVEIGAHWRNERGQRDIVVDEIPGWLPPMWGADEDWLYLRRPEGVWKTRKPSDLGGDSLIVLHQRRANGGRNVVGGMSIGSSLSARPGWIRGSQIESPMEATDRDDRTRPSSRGFDVDADTVDQAWGKHVSNESGRLLVEAGDHFNAIPVFELQDHWLLATDPKTGYRVAFQINGEARRRRIERSELWMLFANRWFDGIEAPVVFKKPIEQSAQAAMA